MSGDDGVAEARTDDNELREWIYEQIAGQDDLGDVALSDLIADHAIRELDRLRAENTTKDAQIEELKAHIRQTSGGHQ